MQVTIEVGNAEMDTPISRIVKRTLTGDGGPAQNDTSEGYSDINS